MLGVGRDHVAGARLVAADGVARGADRDVGCRRGLPLGSGARPVNVVPMRLPWTSLPSRGRRPARAGSRRVDCPTARFPSPSAVPPIRLSSPPMTRMPEVVGQRALAGRLGARRRCPARRCRRPRSTTPLSWSRELVVAHGGAPSSPTTDAVGAAEARRCRRRSCRSGCPRSRARCRRRRDRRSPLPTITLRSSGSGPPITLFRAGTMTPSRRWAGPGAGGVGADVVAGDDVRRRPRRRSRPPGRS